MGFATKKEYLDKVKLRYRTASRKGKTKILDEFAQTYKCHRKHALRLLNKKSGAQRGKRGGKPLYDGDKIITALRRLWMAADQPCSRRLVKLIPEWIAHYERHFDPLDDQTRQKLLALSRATCDRLLKPVRVTMKRKGLCGTKPGTLLKNMIPIKPFDLDITKPGMIEADTVAHCGDSLVGSFVWSVSFTDAYSGWTEQKAVWNKGSAGVLNATRQVEQNLPFPITNFSTDSGSEFITHHLHSYFNGRKAPVSFTRTRPYKKNDNARVEQKNWTHVRQLLGYDRFDKPELVAPINELYEICGKLQNHFMPTFKLLSKRREGSKYVKKYETPQTPYARLMASEHVGDEAKSKLSATHKKLDPFTLRKMVENKLRLVFNILKGKSGI